MYVEVLKRCLKQKDFTAAKQVHDCIIRSRIEKNTYVANNILSTYIGCERLKDARRVFDGLLKKDVISWNIMIGGYAQYSHARDAMGIFHQMLQEGVQPNEITCFSILKACASPSALKWGKEVHAYIRQSGLGSGLRVARALVHMYVRTGSIEDARLVFDRMGERDVITWTMLIGGFAQYGRGHEAFELFLRMQRDGVKPDAITYMSILNACASGGALEWVKEVHLYILEAGLESDLRVAGALVHMYAKNGSLDDARQVFDRMKERDVVTWNIMIGGLANHGRGQEAYELFLRMQREGCVPNAVTYLSILNACASTGALEWVKDLHSHILTAGLEKDLRVGNALVHMYSKSGSLDDARQVFDRMEERDVITWTVMVGGLANHGRGQEAYELFLGMQREGCVPNAVTYLSILNACASTGALEWVKDIHSHILTAGLEKDLRVGNALIHMYAKSGSLDDARQVFDRMEERDVITWTVMIGAYAESGFGEEAYRIFLQMKREGFKPDAVTYVSILNTCASTRALEWVKEVHNHAVDAGFESDLYVASALVHMYAKSGSIDDARLVFDRMEGRDVTTWNVIIGAYAECGRGVEAYQLYIQMKGDGFQPNAVTYLSILNACASAGALDWVKEVHSHVQEAGYELDIFVGSTLVYTYGEIGSIGDARLVFDRMKERNVVTWTAMIGAYAESGLGVEAYQLYLQMKREGFQPNVATYVSILNACASVGALEWVKDVHSHILAAGLEKDLRVGNALVHMYAKNGSIDDARLVFDRMEERDVITWNIMLGGLAQHGLGHEALELFRKMDADGVKPDECSFVAVLSACSHAGLVDEGCRLFSVILQDYGIEPNVLHCNCMVDLLGRGGHLEEAKCFIDNMPVEPNGATWGTLLGACRSYGNVELGELAANEVFKLQPKDASPYVLLSNIYAAAGKWDEVSLVRTMMQERGIRKEPGRSWIEVDDKFHEFVSGDMSHPEAREIYAELNRLIEVIKAKGYIPDTRLVLKNIEEEDKEQYLCSHSEKLAIAFGLMHTPRGKPIRVYKNLRVCSDCHTATKFISKVTGREIVARDANRFHQFKDGVCSCGGYW